MIAIAGNLIILDLKSDRTVFKRWQIIDTLLGYSP